MDRYEALRLYARVVESGSFSKAARAIGVGQPAVSKQIAALEARLGIRLIHRNPRGMSVTAAGQDYYETAVRLIADFEDAEARISQQQFIPSGIVRITAPPAFGRLYILPRLAEFRARYPDVTLDIMVSERRVNLVEEGIDLAIRMGPLSDSGLVARRIGAMRIVTVSAPAYIDAHGAPATPADLGKHDCVVYVQHGDPRPWPAPSRSSRDLRSGATTRSICARLSWPASASDIIPRGFSRANWHRVKRYVCCPIMHRIRFRSTL